MTVEVRELDGSAGEDLRAAWHALEVAVAAEPDWPEPPPPRGLLDAWLDLPGIPGEEGWTRVWAAVDDGAVLGVAVVHPGYGENAHSTDVQLSVHPSARRRGVGRALLEAVATAARAAGHLVLAAGAPRGGPGEAFLAARGFSIGLVERQSELRLADLAPGLLARHAAPADGYRLVHWLGRPDDDLLSGVASVRESMADAPKGDLAWERQTYRPAELARTYALHAARGTAVLGAGVVQESTGELAGFTELQWLSHGDPVAYQGETVVAPAHRSRRLGMAVKATNLLQLLDNWQGIDRVVTWNAEENRYMLAVNVELGFRPVASWLLAELPL